MVDKWTVPMWVNKPTEYTQVTNEPISKSVCRFLRKLKSEVCLFVINALALVKITWKNKLWYTIQSCGNIFFNIKPVLI